MKNNKSQKNTPILGGLFFKSNRDLIKYIKPTWYGDEQRIGPTGALTEGDYNRVERRINKQDESDQKTNKNDPDYAEYLADQSQYQRQQAEDRRGRARTGKYTSDAERKAARLANFGSAEEAELLQRRAESVPSVTRRGNRFDDSYDPSSSRVSRRASVPLQPSPVGFTRKPTAEELAEDDVWTRLANRDTRGTLRGVEGSQSPDPQDLAARGNATRDSRNARSKGNSYTSNYDDSMSITRRSKDPETGADVDELDTPAQFFYSGAREYSPGFINDDARDSLKGRNQRDAYDRLTSRVRAAQADSAADDAERDIRDPEAKKRMDAAMAPREGQIHSKTKENIIQDSPLKRLNVAVDAANNQTTPPANNQTTPPANNQTTPPADNQTTPPANNQTTPPADNQTTPPADTMDPAARARMDKIEAAFNKHKAQQAQTKADAARAKAAGKEQYIENREPASAMGTRLSANDPVQRNPVQRRSFTDLLAGRTSPEMQQLRDKTAASAAVGAGRAKPLSTPQQDRFAQNDVDEIARTTKPPKRPSVWDAGAEGLKKLKNTVLGRSMLHVDRDTMRLNKAVNNAFRKSKKKN